MIKSIQLSNFQSHKDTKLDFDPGVNILCGASDSGKTAILRALKWVTTNRPSGDAFRSNWGGDTEVVIESNDKKLISRRKGKGINEYRLHYSDDDKHNQTTEFAAMGTDVPESVTEVLNINPLSVQNQMDAPFLLSASPGEVARALNEVADLEKIDTTLFNANRMIRENKASLLAKGQEAVQLQSELIQYANVDGQLKQVERVKELDRRAGLMEQMVEKGVYIVMQHAGLAKQLELLPDVKGMDVKLTLLLADNLKAGRLEEQSDRGMEMIAEFDRLTLAASKFKKVDRAEDMLDGLLDKTGQLAEQDSHLAWAVERVVVLVKKESWLKKCESDLKGLETLWQESFPDRCPLCGK